MDVYSFTAGADYRVYAATMTGFRGGSADTLRDTIASDGTTVLEADDDGAIGSASNIAGTVLATAGTYYVRVRQFKTTSLFGPIRPYDFYVRVLSGSPTPEMEPNDKGAPQAPTPNGWVSSVIGPATAEKDTFAITVNAGDTIVAIGDVDPARDVPEWNVIGGIGVFTGSFIIRL